MKSILAAAALLAAVTASATAGTNLYPDSKVVVQDRFSDEIIGQGPDVVFIPGLNSSRAVWKATADRLKNRYRLHLIQVAGFAGETARANASGAVLVPTAEAIDAYLTAQHLTPAILIGHSMGGTMSLYLAEKHPGHYKKVMLVDALPFYGVMIAGPAATADALKPVADKMRNGPAMPPLNEQAATWMASAPADRATIIAWGAGSDASVSKNAMADDVELDLRADLAKIVTPTTLVYPDYQPVGRSGTAAFYEGQYAPLTAIKTVQIAGAVHFVMFDQPAQFAAALDEFLK